MSKQTAENYLDELLNSVNREEKHREITSVDRNFLKELQMAKVGEDAWKYGAYRALLNSPDNSGYRAAAKAEAEFLMEFERELEGDDFTDFMNEFNDHEILPEDRLEDEDVNQANEVQEAQDLQGTQDASTEENMDAFDDTYVNTYDEEPDLSQDSDVVSTGTMDLSQMEEEDLINLLAGTEDLADIGELLSKSDSDTPVESVDAFAAFAANEMAGQSDNTAETNKELAKENKKGGFLDKLKTLLFGKEEEENVSESVTLAAESAPGAEELSEENAQILAAFAEADKAEAAEKSADNDQNKKDKKAKKKKEAKPKKPVKAKALKPAKPKKPKEVDNTPPLPKGPVVLVCILAVSILVLVYFGTELIGYSSAMSAANKYYKLGQYAEAAGELNGIEIKDKDMMFQGKIATLATVDSEVSAYRVFLKNGKTAEALDCLISAAGRCELNEENTLTFNCAGEMGILKDGIKAELQEEFNMTYEEAIELYGLTERNRDEYTIALHKVMDELGIEWE